MLINYWAIFDDKIYFILNIPVFLIDGKENAIIWRNKYRILRFAINNFY